MTKRIQTKSEKNESLERVEEKSNLPIFMVLMSRSVMISRGACQPAREHACTDAGVVIIVNIIVAQVEIIVVGIGIFGKVASGVRATWPARRLRFAAIIADRACQSSIRLRVTRGRRR